MSFIKQLIKLVKSPLGSIVRRKQENGVIKIAYLRGRARVHPREALELRLISYLS